MPIIQPVRDHPLLDADGQATSLFALKRDRMAVVAFIYTACSEAAGCPLRPQAVLQRIDRDVAANPELARRVQLITISFDPERDTPARMKRVSGFYQPQTDWRFVTTRNDAELQPLFADFGQPVAKLRFADGQWSGLFRHVLKVFLLDATNHVRNIYSVGFLNPQVVVNDLRTVLMQPPSGGSRLAVHHFCPCSGQRLRWRRPVSDRRLTAYDVRLCVANCYLLPGSTIRPHTRSAQKHLRNRKRPD